MARMRGTPARSVALVSLALVAATGCTKTYPSTFPIDVGYQPLEANEASWPAGSAADSTPEMLGAPVTGHRDGHDYAHGRAYVKASPAAVWAALQDPMVSRIHGTSTDVVPGAEPFPLTFGIKYTVHSIVGTVEWESAYRGGIDGTADAPQSIGMRYQEVLANRFVRTQSGSLEAAAVDGAPDVTSLTFVTWLDATDSGQPAAWGAVQDWFNDIVAKVHGNPVP